MALVAINTVSMCINDFMSFWFLRFVSFKVYSYFQFTIVPSLLISLLTVIAQFAVLPFSVIVTVTVAVPPDMAVTLPLSTVAMRGFEDFHCSSVSVVPSGLTNALMSSDSPTESVMWDLSMAICFSTTVSFSLLQDVSKIISTERAGRVNLVIFFMVILLEMNINMYGQFMCVDYTIVL